MAKAERNMLSDLTIRAYLENTGSKSPTPGGGCAAALCGALAASLGEMVANLTIGREKYSDVDAEMTGFRNKLNRYREKLLLDIDRDKRAYEKVMDAYDLPKDPEQEMSRKSAIQVALKEAAMVPFDVANDAIQLLGLLEKVVKKGNKNAVTDGITGVLLSRSAAMAAILNVKINLSEIKDSAFKETLEKEVEALEKKTVKKESDILAWYHTR